MLIFVDVGVKFVVNFENENESERRRKGETINSIKFAFKKLNNHH